MVVKQRKVYLLDLWDSKGWYPWMSYSFITFYINLWKSFSYFQLYSLLPILSPLAAIRSIVLFISPNNLNLTKKLLSKNPISFLCSNLKVNHTSDGKHGLKLIPKPKDSLHNRFDMMNRSPFWVQCNRQVCNTIQKFKIQWAIYQTKVLFIDSQISLVVLMVKRGTRERFYMKLQCLIVQ